MAMPPMPGAIPVELKIVPSWKIALFNEADEIIGELALPSPPPEGSRILFAGRMWHVDALQIMPAQPGSPAEKTGEPVLVDVRVSPSHGIHDPDPAENPQPGRLWRVDVWYEQRGGEAAPLCYYQRPGPGQMTIEWGADWMPTVRAEPVMDDRTPLQPPPYRGDATLLG